MIYVVGLLIVLCLAVALNFAMLGQLAARVNVHTATGGGPRPVEGFVPGRPVAWPEGAHPPTGRYAVIVLSTVCATCRTLAGELVARRLLESAGGTLRVLVSTSRADVGEMFAADTGLAAFAPYVDEGGALSRSIGIEMSPTVIGVAAGHTTAAFTATTVDDVMQAMASLPQPTTSDVLAEKGRAL